MNENTKTLIADGRSAAAQGDWEGAWSIWNTAVRQSEDPVSTRGALALILVEFDEPEGAKTQIEKIRESAPAIAASYAAQIGLEIWKHSRKPEAAAAMMELSIAIAEDTGDIPHLAQVSGNLGKVYAAAKNPERALYHFDRASRYYRQLGDAEWESMMRSSAGLALQDLHRLKEAVMAGDEAIATANNSTAYGPLAAALGNRGIIAEYRDDLAMARKLFLRQWDIAQKQALPQYACNAANALGTVYQRMGILGEAERWLTTAVETSDDFRWPGGLISWLLKSNTRRSHTGRLTCCGGGRGE